MSRLVFITVLVFGVVLLALGGWAVRGARWVATGSSRQPRRSALAVA